MFCNNCGAQLPDDAKFCTSCGYNLAGLGAPGGGPSASPPGGFAIPPPPGGGAFVPPARVEVRTGEWISQAWQIVQGDWLNLGLITMVLVVISSVVPIILQGPMLAGLHVVCIKRISGRPADFNDFFKGFNYFVPTLVATILISIFITIGTLLCIIPGLVVAAMYFFTYLFIVDKKMDFWPAMQASHAIVKTNYFGFTMLLVVFILIHLLGVLACLVGLLLTIPLQYVAITIAYKEIVGFTPGSVE